MAKTSIGGQAVIEGVMMRNADKYATCVRKADKELVMDKREHTSVTKKFKILGLPLIRGGVFFIETMVMGMKILTFSAEFFEVEDDSAEPSKFDQWIENKFGEKLNDAVIWISVILAMAISIGLFFILPATLSQLMKPILKETWMLNLSDGILRILILMGYFLLVSKLKDIQRVFEYHGAEHKTINAFESGVDLTVENVKEASRFHKRCGTNFVFIVIAVSIIVLMVINVETYWARIGVRLLCLPLISGISYELLKYFGANDNGFVSIFAAPGMALQRITTSEPDEEQIEVAIEAFMAVYKEEEWTVTSEEEREAMIGKAKEEAVKDDTDKKESEASSESI